MDKIIKNMCKKIGINPTDSGIEKEWSIKGNMSNIEIENAIVTYCIINLELQFNEILGNKDFINSENKLKLLIVFKKILNNIILEIEKID